MFIEISLAILMAAIPMSVPLLLVALGEMFNQKSGQFNLGAEGIMLLGAFVAFWVDLHWQAPWLGLLAAMLIGGLMGLGLGLITLGCKAEQGIAGIGLYLLGWGLSGTLFRVYVGGIKPIHGLEAWVIPILSDLPGLGQLFQLNPIDYLTFLLIPISSWLLFHTAWGLKVRAIGSTPQAADSLGISVTGIRYACLILAGIIAGLAGGYLTICAAKIFADNMTAGRGFIALALVYFGRWKPLGIALGALLFSIASTLQRAIQVYGINFPYELALILPYALVIVVLALSRNNKSSEPAALGRPYIRGQ